MATALTRSIVRNAIGLGLFAVITGGTIALTQGMTRDLIAEQVARAEAQALFEIIPEREHTNNMLKDTITLPDPVTFPGDQPKAWIARQDNNPIGLIMPVVASDGYSGDIRLLVGLDLEGNVLGVRITSHRETPGLGDRIETKKSDWVFSFDGKSLGQPAVENWTVKKDGGNFDQFTGATITPRAVVTTVRNALAYYEKHRAEILGMITATAVTAHVDGGEERHVL